jgi:hypothetical protein
LTEFQEPPLTFSTFQVLTKHRKVHQSGSDGKLKCPAENCEYFSIQSSSLIRHVVSLHPAIYPTMKCSYKHCEFASVNPERLKKHMSFHDMGLFDKKLEEDSVENVAKETSVLNSSMEVRISFICLFEIC